MLKVDNQFIDLYRYTEEEQQEQLKKWHQDRTYIECLCLKTNGYYPLLAVKRSSKGNYHLFNLPRNTKNRWEHADDCPYNRHLQDFLKRIGINIDYEGKYSLKTDKQDKQKIEQQLKFLSYAILQKYEVHRYVPNQKRELHKRLYKACCEVNINDYELSKHVYIANPNYKYNFNDHMLVIGLTDLTKVIYKKGQVELPIYSLKDNDNRKKIASINVFNKIFFEEKLDRRIMEQGIFFLWRFPDQNKIFRDYKIIFIPCEPQSIIPAFSKEEADKIKHLINNNVVFRKPLIMPRGFHKQIIYEEKMKGGNYHVRQPL